MRRGILLSLAAIVLVTGVAALAGTALHWRSTSRTAARQVVELRGQANTERMRAATAAKAAAGRILNARQKGYTDGYADGITTGHDQVFSGFETPLKPGSFYLVKLGGSAKAGLTIANAWDVVSDSGEALAVEGGKVVAYTEPGGGSTASSSGCAGNGVPLRFDASTADFGMSCDQAVATYLAYLAGGDTGDWQCTGSASIGHCSNYTLDPGLGVFFSWPGP